MRRFWFGVGLLLALLLIGFWTQAGMDAIHTPISEALDRAAQAAQDGDWESALALAAQAKGEWDARWHVTAATADHAPMDEVDMLLGALEVYAGERQTLHFAACCAQLSQLIQAVADAHALNWWNLL